MTAFIKELANNKIFMSTVFGWLIAQSLKVALGVIREKKFNFKWFVGSGGMPSSHAATVAALATAVGLVAGVNTALFAVSVVFAAIIILDAQGFRRASGEQAEILNMIVDDIYWKGQIKEGRLKELLGHTPIEVFIGALLGILVAIVYVSRF